MNVVLNEEDIKQIARYVAAGSPISVDKLEYDILDAIADLRKVDVNDLFDPERDITTDVPLLPTGMKKINIIEFARWLQLHPKIHYHDVYAMLQDLGRFAIEKRDKEKKGE